jgi:hypothetical protein
VNEPDDKKNRSQRPNAQTGRISAMAGFLMSRFYAAFQAGFVHCPITI